MIWIYFGLPLSRIMWYLQTWTLLGMLFMANFAQIHSYTKQRFKETCIVGRSTKDIIYVPSLQSCKKTNICQKFGAVRKNTGKCICSCPANKQTFMENVEKCTENKNVWPAGCKIKSRGRYLMGVLPATPSADMKVLIPRNFLRCTITVAPKNSYYLDYDGWKQIPKKLGFPFKIQIRQIRRRRNFSVKWSTSLKQHIFSYKLNGKVIRLGIRGVSACRKLQHCILFKVLGQNIHGCVKDKPIPTSSFGHPPEASTTKITTTVLPSTEHVPPSIANKGERDSLQDDSGDTPWAVTGSIIGIVTVLVICMIVLVSYICRRKKKFNNRQNNTASPLSLETSSRTQPSREQPVYTPLHPYQELKPPVRGYPPGVYHSLNPVRAKEDPSGYLVPSQSKPGMSTGEEPIYNEIGSPQVKPQHVYDYALPENSLRLSAHLTDKIQIDPYYVGRPSWNTKEQNLTEDKDNLTDSTETEGAMKSDGPEEMAYIDFASEECKPQNKSTKSNEEHSPSDSNSTYIDSMNDKGTGQEELDRSPSAPKDFQI